jgi:hypothetical protein
MRPTVPTESVAAAGLLIMTKLLHNFRQPRSHFSKTKKPNQLKDRGSTFREPTVDVIRVPPNLSAIISTKISKGGLAKKGSKFPNPAHVWQTGSGSILVLFSAGDGWCRYLAAMKWVPAQVERHRQQPIHHDCSQFGAEGVPRCCRGGAISCWLFDHRDWQVFLSRYDLMRTCQIVVSYFSKNVRSGTALKIARYRSARVRTSGTFVAVGF